MSSDWELLQAYARERSEASFEALVQRHVNLVYHAALRQVRSVHLAEEVAQSTFADLAREAGRLPPTTVVTGWLYEVARRTAIDVVRRETRRRRREEAAAELQAMTPAEDQDVWRHIEPLLEEAMGVLDAADRTALLLRYFENQPLREVGQALGTSDDTAQKRVTRALERLRKFFAGRGIALGTSGLAVALSAHAAQAAPAGLAASIAAATGLIGATSAMTATAAAANALTMTTLQKSLIAAALTLAVATSLYEVRENARLRDRIRALEAPPTAATPSTLGATPKPTGLLAAAPVAISPTNSGRRLTWESVESPDYRQYIANLRAVGCPEETIRDIVRADVWKLYEDKKQQARQQGPKVQYWRGGPQEFIRGPGRELWGKLLTLDQERNNVLTALGIEPEVSMRAAKEQNGLDLQLDFLNDPAKKAQISRVRKEVEDRLALRKDNELTMEDIDRLRKDAEASIKALLTPEEARQYELRTSPTALTLARQLTAFEPTEQEFLALYGLQKEYEAQIPDETAGRTSEADKAARAAAQERLREGIEKALGVERYAAYQKAISPTGR